MFPRAAQHHEDRKSLSRTVRNAVYNAICDTKPICPVCYNLLTVDDYQIAHLVAVKNNGDNDFSNLTATHKRCNTGTNTIHLEYLPKDIRDRVIMFAYQ